MTEKGINEPMFNLIWLVASSIPQYHYKMLHECMYSDMHESRVIVIYHSCTVKNMYNESCWFAYVPGGQFFSERGGWIRYSKPA